MHRGQSVRTAFQRAGRLVQDSESYLLPIHLCYGLMSLSDPALDTVLDTCGSSASRLQGAINQQLTRLLAVDRGEAVAPPALPQAGGPANKPGKPKKSALLQFGRDLTRLAKEGKLSPVIGRKAEMLRIAQALLQSRKN